MSDHTATTWLARPQVPKAEPRRASVPTAELNEALLRTFQLVGAEEDAGNIGRDVAEEVYQVTYSLFVQALLEKLFQRQDALRDLEGRLNAIDRRLQDLEDGIVNRSLLCS